MGPRTKPHARSALLWAALALALAGSAHAACGSTSPHVGFEGDLTEMEHNVGGRVRILDDCTFEVTGFTYDGNAPAAYWWGAPSTDNGDIRGSGRRIADQRVEQEYNGDTLTVTLLDGVTWDDVPYLLLWCEEYYADFGHIKLEKGGFAAPVPPVQESPSPAPSPEMSPSPSPAVEPSPSPATAPAPAAAPAPGPSLDSPGLGLANCVELKQGYYNVHWEVAESGSEIIIGLEGRVGPGNRWMGFGFSAPNAMDVTMPGSDAVVAGIVGGECFAYDYFLQSRSQCSYTEMSGVCPDFGLSGNETDNQVQLLSCEKVGDVLAVMLMRPIAASDAFDRAWPLDGSGFTVWAMGPVSEGSTAERPVVLYHRLQLPGAASEEIVHAPVGQGYRVNLGSPSPPSTCAPLLATAAAGMMPAAEPSAEAGGPAPGPEGGMVATLRGVQQFDVVTGDNKNYPNPPGWGLSYHVNGQESPALEVVRATTYTFRVLAGEQHPLYLTNSIVGGGSYGNFTGETIYAGGLDSHGTPDQPFLLMWTPDASTPDLLYYQCTVHQKLGWEIHVVDAA
ncbi:hypothetical protein ABPG75_013822 [Micractinium tetrahymenae]